MRAAAHLGHHRLLHRVRRPGHLRVHVQPHRPAGEGGTQPLARIVESAMPQLRAVVSRGTLPNWMDVRFRSGCRYAGSEWPSTPSAPRRTTASVKRRPTPASASTILPRTSAASSSAGVPRPDVHEVGRHAAGRCGERVGGEHVAVGREAQGGVRLADDGDRGVERLPGGIPHGVALHAVRERRARRGPVLAHVAGGLESLDDVRDAGIEAAVPRPAHEAVEVCDRLVRALARVAGAHECRERGGGGGGRGVGDLRDSGVRGEQEGREDEGEWTHGRKLRRAMRRDEAR
jgi:hypothetical protein